MTDLLSTELIDDASELHLGRGTSRRQASTARQCGAGATVSLESEEFRAELACGCPQAGAERDPYDEGFAAYSAGAGLPDNPYHGDNCAHQQWANGWSQARDEAKRQARQ
jgi:hypothetical protein